jgi:hypothetical protein
MTAVADCGEYNITTNVWSIDELKNATVATLFLKTNFSTAGTRTNRISITGLDETDPVQDNDYAEAVVHMNASDTHKKDESLSAKLVIKPTTLNLNSKGVFTVYVSLTRTGLKSVDDESTKPRIDYANSSLTCDGADMIRATVSNKDGRTLIAKFHRGDLQNVTLGEGVQVTCSGILAVNGTMIPVEGSDTIRVVGEKNGVDKILSRLMKFLGLEKEDVEITESEDGNVTVTLSLNPANFKNSGQEKKMLKIKNNEYEPVAGHETGVSGKTRGKKEDLTENNGDDKQIRGKNADNKPNKGNKGSDKREDESTGKSNGKKDK